MIVREVIEQLQKFDSTLEVIVGAESVKQEDVKCIYYDPNYMDGVVVIADWDIGDMSK